ncbi:hypothetical protein [Streptomyces sp. NBC_01235]|nr:hypothetical protein OG289_47070 [Streptomyces sp. NBC_01235]
MNTEEAADAPSDGVAPAPEAAPAEAPGALAAGEPLCREGP